MDISACTAILYFDADEPGGAKVEPAVLEKHSDALLAMVQYVSPAARGPRADAALQAGSDRRRRAARESLERENHRVAGVRWCAKVLLAKFMPEFAEFA